MEKRWRGVGEALEGLWRHSGEALERLWNGTAQEKGIQQGIQQGFQQGVYKEKAEVIQRMKSKGFSAEDISESVGLSMEEFQKLLQ